MACPVGPGGGHSRDAADQVDTASGGCGCGGVEADEPVEDTVPVTGGNPESGVINLHLDHAVVTGAVDVLHAQSDPTAGWGDVAGVVEQVGQDLGEPSRVTVNDCRASVLPISVEVDVEIGGERVGW